MRKSSASREVIQEYLSINNKLDIKSLMSVKSELNRDMFKRDLENIINPMYQIAYNQGFRIWKLKEYILIEKEIILDIPKCKLKRNI